MRTDGNRAAALADRSSGVNGFTIIEALIALVVTGVLAAAMLSLLIGQSRFYERTDDQVFAEQTFRAAVDLMTSEIRMGAPGDLLAAESDSVVLRYDLVRAVVCDSTGTDALTAFVLDSATNANLSGGVTGVAWSGPWETAWHYADGWTPTVASTGSGPKSTCTAAGAPADLASADYRSLTGWSSGFGAVPVRGSVIRAYGKLGYRFAPSSFFASGTALWRGSQELVGPFAQGASFSYVMDDGSVRASVSSGDFADVRAVRVTATAVGDGSNRFGVQRPFSVDIPFRN